MYTKNSLIVYLLNITTTLIWSFLFDFTYRNWMSPNSEQIVVISLSTFVLYILTIHPAIKVFRGTAKMSDLKSVILFPVLGLFRKWCPRYQRMMKKLTS